MRWYRVGSMLVLCVVLNANAQEAGPASDEGRDVLTPYTAIESVLTPLPVDDWQDLSLLRDRLDTQRGSLMVRGDLLDAAPTPFQTDAARALNCGTGKADLSDGWQVFAYSLDRNAAASLSLWTSAELAAKDRVVLYHFLWYRDVFGQDGSVIGRCGSGVELALKASDLSASAQITLPSLAASTQLGQTSVEYRLATFGLSGRAIDEAIPAASAIGTFDLQAYTALIAAIDKVREAGTAEQGVVFRPRLVAIPNRDPGIMPRILVQITALRHIARGSTCAVARAAVPERDHATDNLVNEIYRTVVGPKACLPTALGGGVSSPSRSGAVEALARFGIAVN